MSVKYWTSWTDSLPLFISHFTHSGTRRDCLTCIACALQNKCPKSSQLRLYYFLPSVLVVVPLQPVIFQFSLHTTFLFHATYSLVVKPILSGDPSHALHPTVFLPLSWNRYPYHITSSVPGFSNLGTFCGRNLVQTLVFFRGLFLPFRFIRLDP